ncbi:MAG: hypothetical protein ACMUIL_03405 [bacterium]
MKRIIAITAIFLLYPSLLLAGSVRGTIKVGGRPIEEGVLIKVIPEGNKVYTTKTDRFGSYRLTIRQTGRCRFILENYHNQSPEFEIQSYKNSVEYNFVLERDRQGAYYLRRE